MEITGHFMRALGFLSSLTAPNENIITKLLRGFFLFNQ